MRLLCVLLVMLGAAVGAPGLRAQDPAPLQAGARVRVVAPGVLPRPAVGRVVRVTPDTLVLQTRGAAPVAVPPGAAERMERSLGRSRGGGAIRGAAYGVVAGGFTTGALVLSGADFCIYVSCLQNDIAGAAGGFLIGAGLGLPVGAIIGGIVGVEEWETVSPGPLRALHVSPSGIVVRIALP